STNTTTGANIYDVSVNTGKSLTIISSSGVIDVKTDDKTIKQGSTGALEVVTTNLTVANNGKVDTPTNGSSLVNATTVANAINNSGWNLQANGDTASKVSPGNTVQFLNGGNIDIKRDGNNITVATSKNINVAGDLTVAGNTTVKNFTVNPNSTVNMGGNKVQGVAAGVISANSTDAINGSQLYYTNQAIGANINNVANNLNARINDVADDADAGTASAMATAGVPQAYLPGKSMVAVGASTYRGKQGYAVGFSAISDSGNWIVKGTASGNSRGHFGATVGAGYQW
ncbi:YadA family autotransporter adhesin, partial [Kingella kingae]|uniref:YadA family autotransporter adhesin n=1 Tax=Kingella kingae TaxID=504 RepID=UPI00156302CC